MGSLSWTGVAHWLKYEQLSPLGIKGPGLEPIFVSSELCDFSIVATLFLLQLSQLKYVVVMLNIHSGPTQ